MIRNSKKNQLKNIQLLKYNDSREVSPTNKFYIKDGLNSHETFEINNDSFSFNNNKNIFSKLDNFSCVKKETPKFTAISNQKSTPTENLMSNFAAIKNQIRYNNNIKKIFKNKQEKGGNFFSKIDKKKYFNSHKNDPFVISKNSNCLTRQSSKTKANTSSHKSRLLSLKVQKTPKILSQKYLELFNTNFLLNKDYKKNSKKIISKEFSYNSKHFIDSSSQNNLFEKNIFQLKSSKLKSTSKINNTIFPSNKIRAKELSEDFKNDFFKILKISSSNSNKRNIDEKNSFDNTLKKNKKSRFNIRYQSASKFSQSGSINESDDYSNIRSEQIEKPKNLKKQINIAQYLKKPNSSNKKCPLVPNLDYF